MAHYSFRSKLVQGQSDRQSGIGEIGKPEHAMASVGYGKIWKKLMKKERGARKLPLNI